jgi:hypothetical protein
MFLAGQLGLGGGVFLLYGFGEAGGCPRVTNVPRDSFFAEILCLLGPAGVIDALLLASTSRVVDLSERLGRP